MKPTRQPPAGPAPRLIKESGCSVLIIATLIGLCVAISACSHLTVAPHPVEAHAVAPGSTNQPDADIIDCDQRGCLVRQGYLDSYKALEAKFKEENFPADRDIKAEGPNFRVPFKVTNHFTDMKRKQRLAEAGP